MCPSETLSFSDSVAGMVQRGCFFEPSRTAWIARAPGRLDVMGGNVDYTGGLVLQMPLRHAVWAAVQPAAQPAISVLNPGAAEFGWETALELPVDALSSVQAIEELCGQGTGAQWGRYVLGGFHLLRQRYGGFAQQGAKVFLASDLPPNRGLASSAALEVATLKAASAALGIALGGVALAECAQWVENVVARSACGVMDQAAIVLGRENCLLPLLCQPCQPQTAIRLPRRVRVWGIDSMAPRATNSAVYEAARAAAFMGYKMVCRWEGFQLERAGGGDVPRWKEPRWNGYLSNLRPSEFRSKYERRLPEFLDGAEFLRDFGEHADPLTTIDPDRAYPVRAAVRYATEENHRVRTAKLLIERASPENAEDVMGAVGEVLFQSHYAYTECGLGSGACDELVELARQFGFWGAKMTGGGAGGVVAVLGLDQQRDALEEMAAEYGAMRGETQRIFEGSSDGADIFGAQPTGNAVLAEMR